MEKDVFDVFLDVQEKMCQGAQKLKLNPGLIDCINTPLEDGIYSYGLRMALATRCVFADTVSDPEFCALPVVAVCERNWSYYFAFYEMNVRTCGECGKEHPGYMGIKVSEDAYGICEFSLCDRYRVKEHPYKTFADVRDFLRTHTYALDYTDIL